MADTETSDSTGSLVAPVAVLPIQTVAWEATGLENIQSLEVSISHPHEVTQAENNRQPDEAKLDGLSTISSAVVQHMEDSPDSLSPVDVDITEQPKNNATDSKIESPSSIPLTTSNSPVQQYAIAAHSLQAPQIKRFTSVNITRRFLERTSFISGPSSGTGFVSNTNSVLSSSTQYRGISPNAPSPSFDRPVSSRLVTAKLTAVSQASSASTSGWLRPGQSSNNTTTPTPPPSTSPQPPLHELITASPQPIKRRSGISPALNGVTTSTSSQSNKPVWAKSAAAAVSDSAGRGLSGLDNKSDFPTAAEAVHSMQSMRKSKSGKGQMEADVAEIAHKVAQRNAMNETAAAFRGAHLDTNTRWDEMSDEDSEDFDGVIKFGDGTQYKIEHKPNYSQGISRERSVSPSEPEGPPVAKEERFGEDMGRNWPRRADPAVGQLPAYKPSLPLSVASHITSEAHRQIQPPHEGISPTSRVLFNERLNRLEPLSESKAPFGSRQRDPVITFQTHPSNVQLLQKGLSGADVKNSRGTGSGADRTHWGDSISLRNSPSLKSDERPWDSRRRESMSSATGSSIRDRSRGRESLWELPHHVTGTNRDYLHRTPNVPHVPLTLTHERDESRFSHFRPPTVSPSVERDIIQSKFFADSLSPTMSTPSLHSPVVEKLQSTDTSDGVDKHLLLKSAMHIANERARRRKQESDEGEKRREEAAERARKKAEALAHSMEEKQKPGSQISPESPKQPKTFKDALTEPQSVTIVSALPQQATTEQFIKRPSTDHSLLTNVPSLLSRQPITASRAESWRRKVPLQNSATEIPSFGGDIHVKTDVRTTFSEVAFYENPPVPPFLSTPQNHLSIKPDEDVEVVDFEDLGNFLGNTCQESRVLPKSFCAPTNRLGASDFFQGNSVQFEAKTEGLSWRRLAVKPQLTPSIDGLRTQTVPIFSTEFSPEAELPDLKNRQSPLLSPSKRDYNAQLSPVLSVLRSPRASYFKEAPLSTLTDTMSRIKGALDGMQSHDILTPFKDRMFLDKGKHGAHDICRTLDDALKQHSLASLTEELISCVPPPPSPKPVWNTHTVRLPRNCQIREPLPKKQVHYWNLPYPPVRWDILSWDPPVEGMNKRDLSRDDIFHKKHNLPKGGKLRVVLPPESQQLPQTYFNSTTSTTLVTVMGIKIKLPGGLPPYRSAPWMGSTRDALNTFSCRRSASSSKNEQFQIIPVTSDEDLNTTSRSPPPDSSTLMRQLTPTRKQTLTSFEGPLAANVSLPSTGIIEKGLREPVSFLRVNETVIRNQTMSIRLPTFTVNSELDPHTSEPSNQVVQLPITNGVPTPSKTDLKSLSSQTFTTTPHELPRLIASKPGSKSSEESATRPGTPPSSTHHTTSPWGKGLTFPVKESPTRRGPDPEHLKAVWSQPTSISTGSTSNSLKGITDEQLPSIPSTMQDMKSEDGETPPPTAPAPPLRLSQQEVARAFQQVPESPASRPPTYPQNPLFPQYPRPSHSLALSHTIRPSYPPSYHPHAVMGHSPSPTLMYAPGVDSPAPHQRMPVNGPSPSVPGGVWLPTPPPVPSQHGNYLRSTGAHPPPTQLIYSPPGAPNYMVPHRMTVMGHGSIPPAAHAFQAGSLYAPAPVPDMRNIHVRSPHLAHTTPAHPHAVPMQSMHSSMFSPPPPGHPAQPQSMYTLAAGTNRGVMVPRNVYEGYHVMPPHAGYPTPSYIFPS